MRVPILPPPGLVSDPGDFAAPGVWSSGSNVRFFHGMPQSIGGETALQSGALETYSTVRKLFAYKIGTTVYLAALADSSPVYSINTSTWARTDITPAAGWASTIDRASFAMFGDILLAVPHELSPPSSSGTLFTSTAGAQLVAVANAPDNISCMLVTPSRQVMALGCNEEVSTTYNGRCIRWSDIEDYTDWTTLSSNNAGEYILPGQDDIVGARVVGDHIVIWTKSALFMAQYIGQPGQTFVFTRIGDIGLVSLDCHAEFQGTVYWMAPDFFIYAWTPGTLPTKVECPCIKSVLDDIGTSPTSQYQQNYHAFVNRKYGEVWFFYSLSGSAKTDRYLAYCVNESAATQKSVWFRGTMDALAIIDDPLLIDALNMGDSTIVRGPFSTGAMKSVDQTGGTYPAWSIQTSLYYVEEGGRRVQVQRYVPDTSTTVQYAFSLFVSNYPDQAATEKGPYTITPASTLKYDLRASGRLISAKFLNANPNGITRLGKPAVEVVVLGNR